MTLCPLTSFRADWSAIFLLIFFFFRQSVVSSIGIFQYKIALYLISNIRNLCTISLSKLFTLHSIRSELVLLNKETTIGIKTMKKKRKQYTIDVPMIREKCYTNRYNQYIDKWITASVECFTHKLIWNKISCSSSGHLSNRDAAMRFNCLCLIRRCGRWIIYKPSIIVIWKWCHKNEERKKKKKKDKRISWYSHKLIRTNHNLCNHREKCASHQIESQPKLCSFRSSISDEYCWINKTALICDVYFLAKGKKKLHFVFSSFQERF